MDTSCRTCSRSDEFQGISVNSISESHQEPIYLMLVYCTQLQFSNNDTLPQQVCPDCVMLLDGAFTFWKQCRQTDANFRWGMSPQMVNPIAVPEVSAANFYHCCFQKCSKVAASLIELEDHAKQEHWLKRRGFEQRRKRDHSHVCTVCLAGFGSLQSWEVHQTLLHGTRESDSKDLFAADGGNSAGSDSDEWPEQEVTYEPEETSLQEHDQPDEFVGKVGKKKPKSYNAARKPQTGSVLLCNGCGYQSNKKYNMRRHQQIWGHEGVTKTYVDSVVEETEPATPENEAIQFVAVPVKLEPTLNNHEDMIVEQPIEEKPTHQCSYCGTVMPSKAKKLRHLQFHCPALYKSKQKVNPKQCPKCNKIYTTRKGLSRHLIFCSLGSDKSCPRCGRTFNKSSNLTRHIKMGNCSRKFRCETCQATFLKKVSLMRHKNRNECTPPLADVDEADKTGLPSETAVECPHCFSRLSRMSNLRRHMKTACYKLQQKQQEEVEAAPQDDAGEEG